MSIISTMSLAGTIALGFYYFVKLLFREKYSAYWKMVLLKISMFFYLCPFQLVKYLFPEDIKVYLPDFFQIDNRNMFYFGQTGYITIHNLLGEYAAYPIWKIVVILIWIGVVVIFVSHEVLQYFRLKHLIVKCSKKLEPREKIFYEENRHIEILSSSVFKFPFTTGIIKPIIFIPEEELDDDEYEMICQHELMHIRNHDVLIKFLCLAIILLHWFNPFSYLVLYEFNILSECCCDESVIEMRNMEERKRYAYLLVRFATKRNSSSAAIWTKCFSGSKTKLKKRIGAILEMKKKKSWIILLMAIMSVILGMATTYAYEAEKVVELSNSYVDIPNGQGFAAIEAEILPDFSVADNMFIYEDGNIQYIDPENLAEPYVLCIHAYKDGTYYAHQVKANGGCVVEKYNAKICSKCGKVVIGSLRSTETFVVCPH